MYFSGTLFTSDNQKVTDEFLNMRSLASKMSNGPFLIILNEKESRYSGRRVLDLIKVQLDYNGMGLLFSKRAKAELENLNIPGLEFLPILIKGKNLNLADFFLLNVLSHVDCIDFEKSELEMSFNGKFVRKAIRLVLSEDKIPEERMAFKLDRSYFTYIITHSKIKQVVTEMGLSGFDFQELSEI